MAFTQKRLAGPVAMETSATDLYTAPSETTTIVKQIMLCNTDDEEARTATLHVAASGSVAAGNTIFQAISLDPNETVILNLSLVLADGEKISGLASNAAVTITISGIEEA
jgi:hypothetical protein